MGSTDRHWWFSCGTYLKRLDRKTVQMTDLCAERQKLTEAWEIINAAAQGNASNRKEPWPRALEWLAANQIHRKPPSKLADVGGS